MKARRPLQVEGWHPRRVFPELHPRQLPGTMLLMHDVEKAPAPPGFRGLHTRQAGPGVQAKGHGGHGGAHHIL